MHVLRIASLHVLLVVRSRIMHAVRTLHTYLTARVLAEHGAALDRAIASARGPVVVAGSLYLVGDARRRLVDDPPLHDPEDDGE